MITTLTVEMAVSNVPPHLLSMAEDCIKGKIMATIENCDPCQAQFSSFNAGEIDARTMSIRHRDEIDRLRHWAYRYEQDLNDLYRARLLEAYGGTWPQAGKVSED